MALALLPMQTPLMLETMELGPNLGFRGNEKTLATVTYDAMIQQNC